MRNSVTNPPYDLSSSLLKYVEKLWGSLFLNTTMAQQPTKEILFLTLNGEDITFQKEVTYEKCILNSNERFEKDLLEDRTLVCGVE